MNLQVTINSGLYLIFGSMMLFMSPFFADEFATQWGANQEKISDNKVAMTVATVYYQVIGMCQIQAATLMCPGEQAFFFVFVELVLMMAKHSLVDGLQPPMPIVIMGSLGLAISFYAWLNKKNFGRWYFVVFAALSVVQFATNAEGILEETWPGAASSVINVGVPFVQTVAALWSGLIFASVFREEGKPTSIAYALSSIIGMGNLVRLQSTYKTGPPPFVFATYGALLVYNVAQVFTGSKKEGKGNKGD